MYRDSSANISSLYKVYEIYNNSLYFVPRFQGNLSEQGRLLMQGNFSVWTDHKKDKMSLDLRFKPMQRQIFLYEKLVLFCKKKEDPNDHKASYIYKSSLQVSYDYLI